MRIALASPPIPDSLKSGLISLEKMVKDASEKNVDIICFPESYLPGYPGMSYSTKDRTSESLEAALKHVRGVAQLYSIAIIVPMDWYSSVGLQNVAFVISKEGEVLGMQTKNQLDPTEDEIWIAGTDRQLFEVEGVKFGITICHEGFRYPESVRWAAQNGAKIVFHPQFTANTESGKQLTEWGHKDNPYYEKAMMMRAMENTIYFASVNYASNYSESASSIIYPNGNCMAHQNYGEAGIIVADIDPEQATGLLAKRFKNHLY
ncbi:carbon-nitrogen hydrolase family protein [Pedobacter sp. B4-66]|uniref:carbon-nitrogen hydrolase family protein n=1 Tax=Pedobacter sp. B4-66 TaxID=2817280 RepID=UPI001BDAD647|nr:carbon-nitrogen hydrolase family protein [Pedobacter sp. B4-66]